jgi:hypothetical protein
VATSIEHYEAAERLLAESERQDAPEWAQSYAMQAQVHATLALAAATALGIGHPEITVTGHDWEHWNYAAEVTSRARVGTLAGDDADGAEGGV